MVNTEDKCLDSGNATSANIGPLMLDVKGLELSNSERSVISSPVVGGLILFSRNYDNPQQLTDLIADIRSCSPNIIIGVDHEGGRVQRFRKGFTRIPPMASLGELYKSDSQEALRLARDYGWLIGAELISYDIDISFTPVLDKDYGVSEVIGDRAFSQSSDEIVQLSGALVEGMREAGMSSTGKHFPGHGAVVADSHLEIPVDERCLADIKKEDMEIFVKLFENGLDAVMPAHVIYDKVDTQPAGFSTVWMQDILRHELGFDGVIFSDDLSMEGASVAGSYTERADAALSAGCDMVLVCNNPEAANEVRVHLERLKEKGELNLDGRRLERMRLQKGKQLTKEELEASSVWQAYGELRV